MKTIEIDDDVFAYLETIPRSFDETTPNLVLRRLFGINGSTAQSPKESPTASNVGFSARPAPSRPAIAGARTKAPKAQLRLLVKKGFLRDGQTLYLIDYQGNRVKEISASVSGNHLVYSGQSYSMSNLAQQLLQREGGFGSDSVRGPAHWVTDDGKTVKALWQEVS
jgi:negative regulator of replication initiation